MSKKRTDRWHGAHHYSDKVHLLLVAFIFFAILTLLWSYMSIARVENNMSNNSPIVKVTPILTPTPTQIPTITSPSKEPIACTLEAKLCPDGKTYVGRSGPNCEFTKCP